LAIVENMRLRWVLVLAFATIPVILASLYLVGLLFSALQVFLDIFIGIPIAFVCFPIAMKAKARVKKAKKEELRREDDVLLQAVAFSQSIIFILLNLTENTRKLTLIYLVAVVTVIFYALRAWAKIKDSSKYRYRSMVVFSFVCSNSVTSIISLLFNLPDRFYLFSLTSIYGGIALGVFSIASSVFSRRYDYEGHGFL